MGYTDAVEYVGCWVRDMLTSSWGWDTDTAHHWVRLPLMDVIYRSSSVQCRMFSHNMLTFIAACHTQIQSFIESGICWLPLLLDIHRYGPALSQTCLDSRCCLIYTGITQHWVRDMVTFTAACHTHIQSSIESGICWVPLLPVIHTYSPALSQEYVEFHCCLVHTYTVHNGVRNMLTSTAAWYTQIQSSIESGMSWLLLLPVSVIHRYSTSLSQACLDFNYCLANTDTVQHWVRDMLISTDAWYT